MDNAQVSNRHPFVSLLFIIIIVGAGFLLIGPGIGLAVTSLFYEGDLLQMLQSKPDYSVFMPLMIMQGFASLIGLIIIPLIYIRVFERKPLKPFFRFDQPWMILLPALMATGIAFQVSLTPVIEWNMNFQFPEFMKSFGEWAREREDALTEITKVLTDFQSTQDFLVAFIVIALLPGIGEELVFRGLIQNELKRGTGNPHVAIWTAAFLFSAIHMQFFGFVPRVLLGALFGYLYHWSGNLLVPMFAHFFHNGFLVLLMYLYKSGVTDLDMENNEAAPWPWVMAGLITTFVLLLYLNKFFSNQHRPRDSTPFQIQ